MYILSFTILGEVRMGSDYNVAQVNIRGGYVPHLPSMTFQDKGIISKDGNTCYLVQWNLLEGDAPGFIIWKIEDQSQSVKKSKVFAGCCDDISLLEDQEGVRVRIWCKNKGREVVIAMEDVCQFS